MKLSFFEQNNKTSIEKIKEFESKISLNLPNDYIQFLLEYNGGLLDSNNIKIHIPPEKGMKKGKNIYLEIFSFISIEQLLDYIDDDLVLDYNPTMMRLGDLDGGNFYICVKGENYGKVYISHSVIDEIDNLIDDKYLKISDSFDEFLNKIKFIQD